MTRVLSKGVLEQLREDFKIAARDIVDSALSMITLDGIEDFAQAYPLRIIPDAVGMMPEDAKTSCPMARWFSTPWGRITNFSTPRCRTALRLSNG
jgi:hypothetical protein